LKALVKTKKGPGHLELKEVPEPECGLDQVKIEVKSAGICGTDLHIHQGEFKCYPPVILGHEFSGVIIEVGSKVYKYKKGDRVTVLPSAAVTCGSCRFCKMGYYCFCPTRRGMGHRVNGAFTKFCVAPEAIVYRLPDNVDFVSGALCEPLACCVQATKFGQINAGDTVVISGPGTIGLLSMQLAKLEGARVAVLGTSSDEDRLILAKKLGADIAVNVEEKNPEEIIKKFTQGLGADAVFECAGATSSIKQCLELVRPMGKYVQVGLVGKSIPVNFDQIINKGLQIIGSYGQTWLSWERSLELLAQERVNVKALISDKLPLDRWKEGFKRMEEKKSLKIILYPNE